VVAFIGFPSWRVAHRVPAILRRQDYKFAAVEQAALGPSFGLFKVQAFHVAMVSLRFLV
jgi:hypothetical protein